MWGVDITNRYKQGVSSIFFYQIQQIFGDQKLYNFLQIIKHYLYKKVTENDSTNTML